jgi:hypothetical protein
MLFALFEYSLTWRIKFNVDKCAIVVFNKKKDALVYCDCNQSCNCGNHFRFGNQWIKAVLVYKYLGMELDNCLSFKDFKMRTLARARASMGRIWCMGIKNGQLSVKSSVNLYEALAVAVGI